jgi:hypothetical protein
MTMESAPKVAQPRPAQRGPKGGTKVYARSAVTNGTCFTRAVTIAKFPGRR